MKLAKPLINYIIALSIAFLILIVLEGLFSWGQAFIASKYTFVTIVAQMLLITLTSCIAVKIVESDD